MIPKFVHCKSCGMPLMNKEDHGGADTNNDWCKHCCNLDGTHKTYEEVLNSMAGFMLTKEAEEMSGIKFESFDEAKKTAEDYLKNMPAWK